MEHPQGLYWSDWQDAGALNQGAQEGLNINVSQSAVAEHAVDESHTIKWEGVEVVTIIHVTGRDVL